MEKILKGIKTRNIQELYNIKNISLDGKIETKISNITIYKIDPANIVACDDETKHKIYQSYLSCIRGLPDAFQVIISKEKVNFLKKCEEWYTAYKNMDFSKINSLAEELSENTEVLRRYVGCRRENSIIQNMTAMVNNKKDILTVNQERLCEVM